MGNFTEDLAKGFIQSAVNQVGRDGGKVISNSIYGNAHSTPIEVSVKIHITNFSMNQPMRLSPLKN